MKVAYSPFARGDLERIYEWIAKDSPRNAKSVAVRICDAIEEGLAFAPNMGHRGRTRDTLEWVVHGLPYIVVYRVDEGLDELKVIAIFHGAQDR